MFTGLSTSQFLGGPTLPGAIHTSGIYPSSRLSESYVGQCWTPDQGGVYQVAGSGYAQVRGAKLATTVAEGAILGPELITNEADRTFSSDTGWWTRVGATISGGLCNIYTTGALARISRALLLTTGRRYQYIITQVVRNDFLSLVDSGGPLLPNTTGQYSGEFVAIDAALSIKRTSGTLCDVDILDISIREVIPVFLAPDTYPTRSIRTRFGTARVPTGTSVGMVSSPAFTNKVTCRKTNPTDTTNVTKSGDAAAVLSVVDDTAALAAAGLSQICSTGKVYKLDNSAGSTAAFAGSTATTGNTNKHCYGAFPRVVSGSGGAVGDSSGSAGSITLFTNSAYERVIKADHTPGSVVQKLLIRANAGAVIHFILPELVESSYLPADPIVPLTPAADTLAAFTRAAIYMEEDTAGVFPVVTEVAREYVQNNCFATLGAGGADVFAGWTEDVSGSSTVTQELVDLPPGFTSACKLTTDESSSATYVSLNPAKPISAGEIIPFSFWYKNETSQLLSALVVITNGVTPLYFNGSSWAASGEWPIPTSLTWTKALVNLPIIPSGYTSISTIILKRNTGASGSRYITGISIGDTGIQNPYSSAASLMSDGSVVPVVAGASWAQNFAIFGTCVPDAGGLYYVAIIGSRQTNESTALSIFQTGVWFNKFTSTAYLPTVINVGVVAGYTHAANAPFDYLAIQTIHGMALRVRPHATMVWSAWVTNITTGGKRAAILWPKYQIGALNGGGGIAGKHPKVSIFELGNQATLAAYQDRAMLLAGRITG